MNLRKFTIIMILLLLPPALAADNPVITITDSFTSREIKRNCRIFKDDSGRKKFNEIRLNKNLFTVPQKDVPSFGYTNSIIWVTFTLNNQEPTDNILLFEIKNPIMDTISLYDPSRQYKNPAIAGDMVPFKTREVAYRHPVFIIDVKPGISTYFLKIETTSNSNIPIVIWTPRHFQKHLSRETPFLWLFYGLMIAMIIYNLFIYLSVKEPDYLHYILFILGFVLFRISYNGLAFQYLWPDSIWWANVCIPFLVSFLVLFLILFTRSFLKIDKEHTILNKILLILAGFFVMGMLLSLTIDYAIAIRLVLGVSALVVIVLFVSSIMAWKWAKRQAIFYLVAWSAFLLGSLLNILKDFGIFPHTFITIWGQQIGSAFQVMLLSIGLADRINVMRSTIAKSNKTLVEINNDLDKEREQLSVIFRSIEDGVITCDLDSNIIYINRAASSILKLSLKDAEGRSLTEVVQMFHPDNTGKNIIHELLSPDVISETREAVIFPDKDDRHIIEFTTSSLKNKNSDKTGFIIVLRDVTDRKRLEEEVVKKNKLDALGTLAGGVAHDFNNILTALTGNIGIALLSCEDNEEMVSFLKEAERVSYQARNLTQQLLTFTRGGAPILKKVSLTSLVEDTVLFTLSGSAVTVQFDIQDDLWGVNIDEGQITQVINNLVLNALQAMPGGGTIDISITNTVIKGTDKQTGEYVKIVIKDHGVGIPSEILPKIFDPFFTTKETGSGLGLSSCYFIIQQHEGYIDVDTLPEKGTAFSVHLPSIGVLNEEKYHNEGAGELGGYGKILLMDDEDIIQRSTGKILERLGYNVTLASDGTEAIDLFQKSIEKNEPFDAVILDLTIPGGMGGRETVLKLREIKKDIPVIASSGYSNDPIMANFNEFGFDDFITKPYTVELLDQVIKRVLKFI